MALVPVSKMRLAKLSFGGAAGLGVGSIAVAAKTSRSRAKLFRPPLLSARWIALSIAVVGAVRVARVGRVADVVGSGVAVIDWAIAMASCSSLSFITPFVD